MEFEEALKAMKEGKEVYNEIWNGLKTDKHMFVRIQRPDQNSMITEPYLVMEVIDRKGTTHTIVPWFPSRLDLFSNTWFEINEKSA